MEALIKKQGFTLIELLVSISIIATLIAFLVPNFLGARDRAKDAQTKQNLGQIKNALRLYYNDHQSYPTSAAYDSTVLNSLLQTNYMPSIAGIGYSYLGIGDSFYLKAGLITGSGDDAGGQSQLNCGIGVGVTEPTMFMVCAN